jgi:pre-mRNA-splicing helicase BRR2
VTITIRRDIDEADFETKEEYLEELKTFTHPVDAPYYPQRKEENWWLVIGNANKLLGIKKVTTLNKKPSVTHTMTWEKDAKAYLICDSYMGCDLEKKL